MNVYDSTGRKLGQVNDYGTASDNDGYKVGDVGEDGSGAGAKGIRVVALLARRARRAPDSRRDASATSSTR